MRPLLVIRATLLALLAEHGRAAGRYDAAARQAATAIALIEREAPQSALHIRLLNCYGVVCKYRGAFREGARAYLKALRLARHRYTPDNSVLATLYHNLGGLEHARGRHRRGEPFARRAVALRERALGTDHLDTARDVAALAGILDGLGRHDEAEALHRRALVTFEGAAAKRGWRRREARAEIAATLANLAACLHLQGRDAEALPLGTRALELQEAALGASHPEVRVTRENLAMMRGRS